jgi:O-antigen ligase
MTTNADIRMRIWQAGLAASALGLGLLAGYQPKYAAAAVIATIVAALSISDLAVGLCVFTIVAFLDVLPAYGGSLSISKLAGLVLLLGWIRNMAIRGNERRLIARHPALVALMIGLVVWELLSALRAEQLSSWLDATQSWILDLALFPIVFAALRERRHVTWLFVTFILGALLAAAYGLFVAPPPAVGDRFSGALGPNGLGNTMTVATILAASLGTRRDFRPSRRALAWAAALICMVIVFLTVSREAIVGLTVVLLLTPLIVGRHQRAKAMGVVVLAVTVAVMYFAVFAPASALDRFTTSDTTGSGRTDIWTVGWRMVKAHPIDGVGAGNFQVSSIHYLLQPGTIRFSIYIVDQPKVAHNIYLQVLAELGIVGLLLFLAILGICVSCAVRAASRFEEDGDLQGAALARGLLLALVAMLASQFFGSELFLKELWLLLASGPAVLAIAEAGSARAQQRARVTGAAPASARARLDVATAVDRRHRPAHRSRGEG